MGDSFSFTKWPEIVKCKRPIPGTVIKVLHKFSMPYLIVSDNRTQIVSSEFRKFCEMFTVEYKTIEAPYHPRSNGQAEHLEDTFKIALTKADKKATDEIAL